MKNILLTGGAGYIGSHTAVVLMQSGYRVIIYDNLCNSNEVIIGGIEQITEKSPDFIRGDVRDTARLTKVLEQNQVDAVIHLAGLKAVGESALMPVNYYANNIQGVISLLQAMEMAQVNSLIFSSSATVYGPPQYLPCDENHPTAPTNPYGRTKLQVEEILNDVSHANPAWKIACLRYFNPAGAHDSGLIGENPKSIPNNLMPYVSRVALGHYPYLRVFGSDYETRDGTGERDYVHVMDLAEAHLAALLYIDRHQGLEVINIGTGKSASVLEIVSSYEKISGKSIPLEYVDRRPGDLGVVYASCDKANRLLSWRAHRSIQEMCATSWKYVSKTSKC